tara:strand:+ start:126 stop:662 length:537 start_codon:yes stop_codon:yes gene_type:complete
MATPKNYSTESTTTISFKSVGEKIAEFDSRIEREEAPPRPIGIKTPIQLSVGSLFDMHFDLQDAVADNLRNLILTNKGERLGNPLFGTDLRKTQYDTPNKQEAEIEMMAKINSAVKNFMPFVNLVDFTTSLLPPSIASSTADPHSGFAGGALSVRITYTVPQISNVQRGITLLLPMGV